MKDRNDGFVGVCLFYGFGGREEESDLILSAEKAWQCLEKKHPTFKSPRADFNDPSVLRAREEAQKRPRGFYWMKVQLGYASWGMPVAQYADSLGEDWRMGPEGIQFLLTHPDYFAQLGSRKTTPYVILPEFEVSSQRKKSFNKTLCLMLDSGRKKLLLASEEKHEGEDPLFGFGTLRKQ